MKTKTLLAGILLAGFSFTVNAQNVSSTNTLTSGGSQAGTSGAQGVYYGHMAGLNTTTGERNTFIGHQNGKNNTTGHRNTFLGAGAGFFNTTGYENTTIGAYAGEQQNGVRNTYLGAFSGSSTSVLSGSRNVYIGYQTAHDNPGSYNGFLGFYSGYNSNGSYNVFMGDYSGYGSNGNHNVLLGHRSGYNSDGNNNVFIGNYSGYNLTGSNLLCIENSSASVATPLIWGDFSANQLKLNGKVGIGLYTDSFPTMAGSVDVSDYNLIVEKGILTEEVRVMLQTSWADYVFEENYNLPSLNEVERYIEENGHLPNTPSAKEVKESGIELGEMAKVQQEKIEELTLYTIQQQKQLEKQQKEIEDLKALVYKLIDKE